MLIEVLSKSTEGWDRGGKFERYESLLSVREYVLVAVDQRRIEVYRREPGALFTRQVFVDGDEVELQSLGIRFPIAKVYAILDAEAAADRY